MPSPKIEVARFNAKLAALEAAFGDGPFFNGEDFSLVDAAYAPFLQRFAMVEGTLQTGLLDDFPLVKAWSAALLADPRITGSVPPSFEDEFRANLKRRGYYVGALLETQTAAE